jgi:hypothetical protein
MFVAGATGASSTVVSGFGSAVCTVATASGSTPEPVAANYIELNQALEQLHTLDSDDEWKIQAPVYNASVQVAAALMEKNIPRPGVFTHGPKSVVFNWSNADINLYLTVSKSKLSVLASSQNGIELRTELARDNGEETNRFFSALSSARLVGYTDPAPMPALVFENK